MRIPDPPLLLVTAREMARWPLEDTIASALAGGCRWVMVREKTMEPDARRRLVEQIVERAEPYGATVIVNSDLELAGLAHGVHLPQGQSCTRARELLGSDALIGVSAHTAGEAGAAASAGADYVTLSPIFPTVSKPGYGPPLTLQGFSAIVSRIDVPAIALGGVTAATAAACRRAGAAGIAVMGTIMRASDPATAVAEILRQWHAAEEEIA